MHCSPGKLALLLVAGGTLLAGSTAFARPPAAASVPKKAKAAVAPKASVPDEQPPSVLDTLDKAMADKCSCSSQADCTCKKGKCECKKCGGNRRTRMIDSLKGEPSPLELPQNARNDASAGVFI